MTSGDDRRRERALGHQRDEHGREPDRDRADDGEERRQEGQHGQRHRERDPEHHEREPDEQRVDQRDQRDPVHVAGQHAPDALAELVGGRPVAAEQTGDPAPHLPPVLDEEERQHERQEDRGEHVERGQRAGHGAARELLAAALERLDAVVDRLVDLGLRDAERLQQLARLAAALLDVASRPRRARTRTAARPRSSTTAITAIPATTTSSEAARGCIPRSRSRCASGTSSVDSSSATTTGSTTSMQLARHPAGGENREREQQHAPRHRGRGDEAARDALGRARGQLTRYSVASCLRDSLRSRHVRRFPGPWRAQPC